MDLKLDTLRTTTNLKNILSRIKGITGIQYWNVLCRWGLSLSLKQKKLPRLVDEKLDGVEIDFDVFVGKNKNIYTQLLINNLRKNKIEINRDNAYKYLIAHVNRGINIIYNKKLKNITELFEFD
jgi:DNA sulfur modification protein DndE